MPQYVGAVRVMVVAGRDGAFGSAEKSVPVRQDLMILPTLPRVVRPGEDVDLPVSVFVADADDPARCTVTVETERPVRGRRRARSKTVAFAKPGRRDRHLPRCKCDRGHRPGPSAHSRAARRHARRPRADVAHPRPGRQPAITETTQGDVEPGRDLRDRRTSGRSGSRAPTTCHAGGLGAAAASTCEKRLQFLIQYPHGCLEQTLSAAFPQLYLKCLVKLEDRQTEARSRTTSGAAIEKLRGFQTAERRVSPTGRASTTATSGPASYAGYFLLEAARLGYHVPAAMLDAWQAAPEDAGQLLDRGRRAKSPRSRPSGCSPWPWPGTPTSGP
ncbi:MAG: hypothetical protein MZV64_68055 [Ignavibacteriales bacterium]|nr:hypothetical protein [Ignavibacteriales bacterium]